MRQLDENKLKGLLTADELLCGKYGLPETESRKQFDSEARAYYCGIILRDRRRELRMTQQELADKTGTNRSYISRIEKGDTDIQLSSFLRIISAMNLSLELHAV